ARPGATGSPPAYKPGTAHTVPPSAAPWLLPDLDTTASAPATGPGVVSRHRVAPLTGALVATGRRRWRLPAGCVSPHGRTGGGLAWRKCRPGPVPGVQRVLEHVAARRLPSLEGGLCRSASVRTNALHPDARYRSRA